MFTVQFITAEEAFPLRRHHLRPQLPASRSRYAGDDHPASVHAGAFADSGSSEELVGVVSFLPRNQSGELTTREYQLNGMVTLPSVRNQGVGTRLADFGIARLVELGATRVWCNGRTPSRSFYERLGFRVVGDEFITPGTGPHYRFIKDLS